MRELRDGTYGTTRSRVGESSFVSIKNGASRAIRLCHLNARRDANDFRGSEARGSRRLFPRRARARPAVVGFFSPLRPTTPRLRDTSRPGTSAKTRTGDRGDRGRRPEGTGSPRRRKRKTTRQRLFAEDADASRRRLPTLARRRRKKGNTHAGVDIRRTSRARTSTHRARKARPCHRTRHATWYLPHPLPRRFSSPRRFPSPRTRLESSSRSTPNRRGDVSPSTRLRASTRRRRVTGRVAAPRN